MKTLRSALSFATLALLGLGYAGSQVAALTGPDETSAWSIRIDSKPVASLALVLLVAAVILGLVRDREEQA